MSVKVVAEIGWNFMGNMNLAQKMIEKAASNGAEFAKFQTWSVKRLKPGPWDTDGRREIYERAELTEEMHRLLIGWCAENSIQFMSSVFSMEDAYMLRMVGCKNVKIPSFESRNHELIAYCAEHFDLVVMSTGTSTIAEVNQAVKFLRAAKEWYLLHCVSVYPCDYSMANLGKMGKLFEFTENVGYSDHIEGVESAKIAIAMGATMIEKHFTTNRDLPGRDNKFAILPDELNDLTTFIQRMDLMHIGDVDSYNPKEKESREIYSGRFNG